MSETGGRRSEVLPTEPEALDAVPARFDDESRAWLDALQGASDVREDAIARLHALLLRAARFEVTRRQRGLAHLRGDELQDIAMQSADDALLAVLAKLDGFHGASRFTTWAYKFALLEAAVALRRRAWQGREVVLDPDRWPLMTDTARSPHQHAETTELLTAIGEAVDSELTPHQREVLVAVTLDDVPIDVLAERLGSNRNALYKTLHDARRKLRSKLAGAGLTLAIDNEGTAR
jgi:RNA polymerase sigma-70 factor (ECF subfamily)